MRVVDTLALHADGTSRASLDIHRQDPYASADSVAYRPIHDRRPSRAARWRVQRNEDGRYLCLAGGTPPDSACAPLKVVPGTSLQLGDVTYARAR